MQDPVLIEITNVEALTASAMWISVGILLCLLFLERRYNKKEAELESEYDDEGWEPVESGGPPREISEALRKAVLEDHTQDTIDAAREIGRKLAEREDAAVLRHISGGAVQ